MFSILAAVIGSEENAKSFYDKLPDEEGWIRTSIINRRTWRNTTIERYIGWVGRENKMKNNFKLKATGLLLVCQMTLSSLPVVAMAQEHEDLEENYNI